MDLDSFIWSVAVVRTTPTGKVYKVVIYHVIRIMAGRYTVVKYLQRFNLSTIHVSATFSNHKHVTENA